MGRVSYDAFAIWFFCTYKCSEYVHYYDVSAMICFRVVFSVPDWYVYFPVPDRYLYYKKESAYDGGLNLGFLYLVITGILGRVSYDAFAIWFFCTQCVRT